MNPTAWVSSPGPAEESRPWTSSEVQALLSAWADPEIQDELDSCVRNEKVFTKIQGRLLETSGSSRSVKQVREKIKRLKADYKRAKEQSRRGGGGGGGGSGAAATGRDALRCKHFELIDAVLGREWGQEGGPSPPTGVIDPRSIAGPAAPEPVKQEAPGDSCEPLPAQADARCGDEERDAEETPELVHPAPPIAPPPNSTSHSTNTRTRVPRLQHWGSSRERAGAASRWRGRHARDPLCAQLVRELRAERALRERHLRQLVELRRQHLRAEQRQRALEFSSYSATNLQLVSILGQVVAAVAAVGGAREQQQA